MTCQMAMITGGEPCCEDDDHPLTDAIDAVCNCVVRPVGSLKPHIPQTAESERALMALLDAMGRAP